jgi:hypothetical protein
MNHLILDSLRCKMLPIWKRRFRVPLLPYKLLLTQFLVKRCVQKRFIDVILQSYVGDYELAFRKFLTTLLQ